MIYLNFSNELIFKLIDKIKKYHNNRTIIVQIDIFVKNCFNFELVLKKMVALILEQQS